MKGAILLRYIAKNIVIMYNPSYEQRSVKEVFLKKNKSKIEIAQLLKIDKSIVCRELQRLGAG